MHLKHANQFHYSWKLCNHIIFHCKKILHIDQIKRKTSEYYCKRNIKSTHFIFNRVHLTIDINDIYELHGCYSIFTIFIIWADGNNDDTGYHHLMLLGPEGPCIHLIQIAQEPSFTNVPNKEHRTRASLFKLPLKCDICPYDSNTHVLESHRY